MKRFYDLQNRKQSRLYQQGQAILENAKHIFGILNELEKKTMKEEESQKIASQKGVK